jgi:hypothetical protein
MPIKSIKKNTIKKNTRKIGGNDCTIDATFDALIHWNKKMFEELGWMILAKHYGMYDKVSTYKNSVNRLKCAIERKIQNIKSEDKKQDLVIMLNHVNILIKHIEADFDEQENMENMIHFKFFPVK